MTVTLTMPESAMTDFVLWHTWPTSYGTITFKIEADDPLPSDVVAQVVPVIERIQLLADDHMTLRAAPPAARNHLADPALADALTRLADEYGPAAVIAAAVEYGRGSDAS